MASPSGISLKHVESNVMRNARNQTLLNDSFLSSVVQLSHQLYLCEFVLAAEAFSSS
uniref:Uncharacterized protein n=1 Tax=Solanum lycopersicum TaxID=4081 RepID=A0A3Q7EDJ7_SOLLC